MSTKQRKPLTKIETETLEWMKGGKVGPGPSKRTGNTHLSLERKGYVKTVQISIFETRDEFPEE